jgi:manganese transport protein
MGEAVARANLTERTRMAIGEVLHGRRRGWRAAFPFAGPAFIASVAYMDPGNFATNIQAGAGYGYRLLWVVVLANLVAMLFQAMSAKLGIVTGRNLPELCRAHFPAPIVWPMWGLSEVAAMATDLAEFLGGAIGLSLLFGVPLIVGMAITAVVTYAILSIERAGFRPMELVIGALVGLIGLAYLIELLIVPPHWGAAALHSVWPQLPDTRAVTLAVGIVGATVMPHAIYLHSGLTQDRARVRNEAERRALIRFSNREVLVALGFAGLVNMAMVIMASDAFSHGHPEVAEIGAAYHTLVPLLGMGAAGAFLVALMASGISASAVGTMAGQMIMQGFVGFRIPIWLRRMVTMIPAFFVVAMGYDPTLCLVISQVVLSLVLPVPIAALLVLGRRRSVMGNYRTTPLVFAAATSATMIVLTLNVILLLQILGVSLPGFAAV